MHISALRLAYQESLHAKHLQDCHAAHVAYKKALHRLALEFGSLDEETACDTAVSARGELSWKHYSLRSAMTRKSWLASVQEKMGLESRKARRVETKKRAVLTNWDEFKEMVKKKGKNIDRDDEGAEKAPSVIEAGLVDESRDDISHDRSLDLDAPERVPKSSIEQSSKDRSCQADVELLPNSTRNLRVNKPPESINRINASPHSSIGSSPEPTTHPDFDKPESSKVKSAEPRRITRAFSQRISGSAQNIWPRRRLSLRGWKTQDNPGNEGGASKDIHTYTGEHDMETNAIKKRSSAATIGSDKAARAYNLFINAAHGVAAATAPRRTKSTSTPPVPRHQVSSQTPQDPTTCYSSPHPASLSNSPSTSSSFPASPTPRPSLAPEVQAFLDRIDSTATRMLQRRKTPHPSTNFTTSIGSMSTTPERLGHELPQRSPSMQAIWKDCEGRLDSVAAEAAEQTRTELERAREGGKRPGRMAVHKAVALTAVKPKLVVNKMASQDVHKDLKERANLGSAPEMLERKARYRSPWDATWGIRSLTRKPSTQSCGASKESSPASSSPGLPEKNADASQHFSPPHHPFGNPLFYPPLSTPPRTNASADRLPNADLPGNLTSVPSGTQRKPSLVEHDGNVRKTESREDWYSCREEWSESESQRSCTV